VTAHGLTGCARVYRIPAGVKYLVFSDKHDYRGEEMLQLLKGTAVQIVVEDSYETVFIWPESPQTDDAVAGTSRVSTS